MIWFVPEGHIVLFLSIHPEYVSAMAQGTKTVELRKQVPRCKPDDWIAIYSSSPVMRLEAVARITSIMVSTPKSVWEKWRNKCGVSKLVFDNYFLDSRRAVAIELNSYRSLPTPISLVELRSRWHGFHPPQGFRYLTPEYLASVPEITCATEQKPRKAA